MKRSVCALKITLLTTALLCLGLPACGEDDTSSPSSNAATASNATASNGTTATSNGTSRVGGAPAEIIDGKRRGCWDVTVELNKDADVVTLDIWDGSTGQAVTRLDLTSSDQLSWAATFDGSDFGIRCDGNCACTPSRDWFIYSETVWYRGILESQRLSTELFTYIKGPLVGGGASCNMDGTWSFGTSSDQPVNEVRLFAWDDLSGVAVGSFAFETTDNRAWSLKLDSSLPGLDCSQKAHSFAITAFTNGAPVGSIVPGAL